MTTKLQSPQNLSAIKVSRFQNLGKWAAGISKYTILVVLAISFVIPFIWMFTSALKDDPQVFVRPPVLIPSPAFWNNFGDAWVLKDFNQYMFNTIFKYCIPVTFGTVFSSAIVAYGFSRIQWRGREVLFFLCVATMMIPDQVVMVPLFLIFQRLGWVNTYLPLIVPAFFGSPYFIFLLRQFFRGIPSELSDAAYIDGASEFDILFKIMFPLAKPALAVVGLFTFMGAWNDYLWPKIYLYKETQFTLALGLEALQGTLTETGLHPNAYPYLMAVSTVITVPFLILFFFTQRTFIEGITFTGMKG